MAPPNLKKMLAVKIKPRKDSYSDQFSRILMVKLLMLTAAVTGISWMKEKIVCVIPKNHGVSDGFVSKNCWINGLYIYRNIKPQFQSYYYGIPKDISFDGVQKSGSMCSTRDQDGNFNPYCTPLEKTFYVQYQWFPIGVAALSFLYYLPYLLFCFVNRDIEGVKEMVKDKSAADVDYEHIIKTYFSRKGKQSLSHHRVRSLLNILVKVLYVAANLAGMLILDSAMNGNFLKYGVDWSEWTERSNDERHNYMAPSDEPKAGHQLLPGFGLCMVNTAGNDYINAVGNIHTYVCELSEHVLYQYILIVMWYAFIIGIIVSIVGLLKHFFDLLASSMFTGAQGTEVKRVYRMLTTREKEYMEFIRRKNLGAFSVLIKKMTYSDGMSSESDHSSFDPPPMPEKEMLS